MSITYSPEPETVGAFVAAELRAAMGRRRVSQAALASLLGVTQQWVSRRLSGEVAMDIEEIGRIAAVLGVPMSSLLPHDEDALRLSLERRDAGQDRYSGSDGEQFLDAIEQQLHAVA